MKLVKSEDMQEIGNRMTVNMTMQTDQLINGELCDKIIVPKEFWIKNPDLRDKIYSQEA